MTTIQANCCKLYFQDLVTFINAVQKAQLMGEATIDTIAHEWPGVPNPKQSAKTGYGFTLYFAYYKKGSLSKDPIVVMNRDFNSSIPGNTVFEHTRFEEYLHALDSILQYLHKNFDLNMVTKIVKQMVINENKQSQLAAKNGIN